MIVFIICTIEALPRPNMFLGTGGFGFGAASNSPHAQLPFGMMRLGPDTTPLYDKLYFQFQHFSGYHFSDDNVQAFSHMHLVGAGQCDLGILGVLPIREDQPSQGNYRKIWINKSSEYAQPGFYSTTLQGGIQAQFTTSVRSGIHKYTCPDRQTCFLHIMPNYFLQRKAFRTSNYSVNGLESNGSIFSKGSFSGRFGGMKIHFASRIEGSTLRQGYWKKNKIFWQSNFKLQNDNQTGYFYQFKDELLLRVSISYVSQENSWDNMQNELGRLTFSQLRESSRVIWLNQLSRFQLKTYSPKDQVKLDTAIYRTLQSPTIFQDFNGQYLQFNTSSNAVRNKPPNMNHVYTDLSLWDVHRTQMPWLLLHDFQRYQDVARSIALINREGGYMPKWPFANGYTGCMIGAHANVVLSDWILSLSPSNDSQILKEKSQIFSFMQRNANTRTVHDQRPSVQEYIKLGYLPYQNHQRSSVSETLELSYNDYCIGKVAQALSQDLKASQFERRSNFYKNLFNKKVKFFQPRSKNGSWIGLNRLQRTYVFSNYYVQGDSWHYRFYAPHSPEGLSQLFEGNDKIIKQLDIFLKNSLFWKTNVLPNPYFWAGNQHDLMSPWLFSQFGRSDLTAKYVHHIRNKIFGVKQDGIPGNDDYGTMSAWLIFAQLGFYPIPCRQTFILGSPSVIEGRIVRRCETKDCILQIQSNYKGKYQLREWQLNGKRVERLSYADLRSDSKLKIIMI